MFKNQDNLLKTFKDHKITTIEEYDKKAGRGEYYWGEDGTTIWQAPDKSGIAVVSAEGEINITHIRSDV